MTIEWDNDIEWDNEKLLGTMSICCAEVAVVVATAEYCSDGSAAAKSPF